MNNKFRVVRGFWLNGQMHEPGQVLTIEKREDMSNLLSAGRIEAADKKTADSLRSKSSIEWKANRPGQAWANNVNY